MSPILLASLLGFRHGADPDHVVALSDISALRPSIKNALKQSFAYAAGHALVLFVLGLFVMLISSQLPAGINTASTLFVGGSLLGMGLWVLYGLVTQRASFRPVSRWALIGRAISKLTYRHKHAHGRAHGHHVHAVKNSDDHDHEHGHVAMFSVGMAHGVGAETPSQVAILAAAAGASLLAGLATLVAFIAGLFIMNMLIAIVFSFTVSNPRLHQRFILGSSFIIALVSVWFGASTLLSL